MNKPATKMTTYRPARRLCPRPGGRYDVDRLCRPQQQGGQPPLCRPIAIASTFTYRSAFRLPQDLHALHWITVYGEEPPMIDSDRQPWILIG